MGSQTKLEIMDYDEFIVPTANTVKFHIGNYPSTSDTATNRYINIDESYRGALGLAITADQGISITNANDRTLKVPKPIAANGELTIRRGDWRNITFNTTVANTTIKVFIVG